VGEPSQPLPTRRATIRLAKRLAPAIEGGDLLVLAGDLGAGKTFFARALCRALSVPAEVRITSPTFTLVHEYRGRLPILHVDAYRLRDAAEMIELGVREQRAEGAAVIVEWGERYLVELGGDGLVLTFDISPAGDRAVRATPAGPRGVVLARACQPP
jgi:tRNA threonylcarbamoyladenosine biosynthesis protein TsaE